MSNAVKMVAGGSDLVISNDEGTKRTEAVRIALAAAGATSTAEVFDGLLGVVVAADVALNAAGTDYEVDDEITIASPAEGGRDIIITVLTVDAGGEILTFSVSQEGTGFVTDTGVAVTGGSGNDDATFDVTADDTGAVSIGKISGIANTHDALEVGVATKNGASFRVTGASAKGYLYFL